MLELMILAVLFVNADGTGQYPTIQAAVDASQNGDEVVLEWGTFTGAGNREVDFKGLAITIRSIEPDVAWIDSGPHPAFILEHGEGPGSKIVDVAIYPYSPGDPALLGAICIRGASPYIDSCQIGGTCTGIYVDGGAPIIHHTGFECKEGYDLHVVAGCPIMAESFCNIQIEPGACVRSLENQPIDEIGPLNLMPTSFGAIKERYR